MASPGTGLPGPGAFYVHVFGDGAPENGKDKSRPLTAGGQHPVPERGISEAPLSPPGEGGVWGWPQESGRSDLPGEIDRILHSVDPGGTQRAASLFSRARPGRPRVRRIWRACPEPSDTHGPGGQGAGKKRHRTPGRDNQRTHPPTPVKRGPQPKARGAEGRRRRVSGRSPAVWKRGTSVREAGLCHATRQATPAEQAPASARLERQASAVFFAREGRADAKKRKEKARAAAAGAVRGFWARAGAG